MTELEMAIKGLECCVLRDPDDKHRCDVCPYNPSNYDEISNSPCVNGLKAQALALLKAQEPRVVTTADFENNPNLDDREHLIVWEEYKDSTCSGWNTINVNDVRAFTDIRRYWTARPTEEQRKAVKWDD